jgi:hypothetical protein
VVDRSDWQPARIYCADGSDRLIADVLCAFDVGQFVLERVVHAELLPAPGTHVYMGKYLKTVRAVRVDPDGVTVYHYR